VAYRQFCFAVFRACSPRPKSEPSLPANIQSSADLIAEKRKNSKNLLFSAVPTEAYIIANFEETQLENMRVGQPVRVRVDAFPSQRLDGHIDSFQRETGSNFALLPPENATGNFVKVVQRVPVKIIIDGPADAPRSISPGMSVEPTVTIAPQPSWLGPFLSLIGEARE
jgi:multidrug resistance efflux pump